MPLLSVWWFAQASSGDPMSFWLTALGPAGAVAIVLIMQVRDQREALKRSDERLFGTILPLVAKVEETLRMQSEVGRQNAQQTKDNTDAINALTQAFALFRDGGR